MMFSSKNVRTMLIATTFALAGAGATYAIQDKPKEGGGAKTKHGELPGPVKSAAEKFFGSSFNHKTAIVDGFTQYQCRGTRDGRETEAVFTESGDLIITRKFMKPSELPAAALANFRNDFKDAKVTKVAEVETHFFAITFDQKGNDQRVKTYPNGRVWKHADTEDDKD